MTREHELIAAFRDLIRAVGLREFKEISAFGRSEADAIASTEERKAA